MVKQLKCVRCKSRIPLDAQLRLPVDTGLCEKCYNDDMH